MNFDIIYIVQFNLSLGLLKINCPSLDGTGCRVVLTKVYLHLDESRW